MRTYIGKTISAAICIILLAGCAEVELASHVAKKIPAPNQNSASKGYFKVGNPYRIKGALYRPAETYSFTQTGVASWYGPNFHGKQTANGETFDMYALTAAHKTLQMPSIVRVTNLANGKSIIVRVNDRGPFSKSRIIDLSKRSAQLLGFEKEGTTRVKMQVLTEESHKVAQMAKSGKSTRGVEIAMNQRKPVTISPKRPPAMLASVEPAKPLPVATSASASAPSALPSGIYVQTGSFGNAQSAQKMVESLRSFGKAHIQPKLVNGRALYRVRFGPMRSTRTADILLARLDDAGRQDAIVVID